MTAYAGASGGTARRAIPWNSAAPRKSLAVLAVALVTLLSVSGCALTGANGTGPLAALSSQVGFGNVSLGTSGTQPVTLMNRGTAPLTVKQATITGTGFSISGLTLPATILGNQKLTFKVNFTPSGPGNFSGSIALVNSATPTPFMITLNATAVSSATPQITLNPPALNFGNVTVGTSNPQTITLKNTGNANLSVTQATLAGAGFSLSGLTLPLTLTPNQQATFTVTYAPAAPGAANGNVTVMSNAGSAPAQVPLSGMGVQPGLTANPSAVSEDNVTVGSSNTKTVTLANTGNAPVNITSASITGNGFSTTGLALPMALQPNQSFNFGVKFTPTAAGLVTGTLTISSNAPNSPTVIQVAGNGVVLAAGISVNPTSIAFGNVAVNGSASRQVSVTNTGNANLIVSNAAISGAGFTMSALSQTTIAPNASANFNVQFAPTAPGNVTGSVTLTTNVPGPPTSIPLSGGGVASAPGITVNPPSLAFNNVTVGGNASLPVTITNTGNANLIISNAAISGAGFTMSALSQTTIAPNGIATFNVQFAPAAPGNVTGSVTLTSNVAGPPTSIPLSGNGVAQISHSASVAWDASDSPVVGYNIYRGTVSGGPYTKLNSSPLSALSFTDNSVQAGRTYFYVVTSVDGNGMESVFSNEVTVTIPTP